MRTFLYAVGQQLPQIVHCIKCFNTFNAQPGLFMEYSRAGTASLVLQVGPAARGRLDEHHAKPSLAPLNVTVGRSKQRGKVNFAYCAYPNNVIQVFGATE